MKKIYYNDGVLEPDRIEDKLHRIGMETELVPIPIDIETMMDVTDSFCALSADVLDELRLAGQPLGGVLLACDPNHRLVSLVAKIAPHAAWGASVGMLAAYWIPDNHVLVMHETMHLFGVDDCYGSCGFDGCLMQYVPTPNSVAPWPECLCARTKKQLKGVRI